MRAGGVDEDCGQASQVIEEFRASNGQVTNPMLSDIPLVLLTTTGARTRRAHTAPLAYFADGPGRIFV